ncbi:MAG: hypothetical protein KJN76_09680, partial [Eudoraea sp.]|nr:hypothetical protein [Eudoraea sp.]
MLAAEDLKEALYRFCLEYANTRIAGKQKLIQSLQQSMAAETKSSAGDKHETGRAMLQLEREKLGRQLLEAEKTREQLNHVKINQNLKSIGPGSLVHTSLNSYFIAISSGEYKHGKENIYCVSPATPIGRLLLGKCAEDQVSFNNTTFTIDEVL